MIKKCLCSLCASWGWRTQANALISGKGALADVPVVGLSFACASADLISCSRTHAFVLMLMDCHVGSAHSNPLCRL